jgi:protein-tyrosine phosphatase
MAERLLALAIRERLAKQAGGAAGTAADELLHSHSAGTGGWHAGEPPDRRATIAAQRRGITLAGAARQVTRADFRDFDLLIALDRGNLRELLTIAPDEDAAEKVRLLREFDPAASGDLDVPDPYYGGDRGFETVLDMVEAACRGLIDELRAAGKT